MKIERTVQILFYVLVLTSFFGAVQTENGPLIPGVLRNVIVYTSLTLLLGFIIYYYVPKKKKH